MIALACLKPLSKEDMRYMTKSPMLRKFIVLERDGQLALAIGPLIRKGGYPHSELFQAALTFLGIGHEVRGGGSFYFVGSQDDCLAYFDAKHGEFGVYDKRIVAFERDVARELKVLRCEFV